ncbi:MAG: TatD family hydrolase [Bacteroidales bacterium]|nr:TatD family hydrolase [Bacteroidales bacterium]
MKCYDLHTHRANPDFPSVGLHPWHLTEQHLAACLLQLEREASRPEIMAIGEAGLDRLCGTPFPLQLQAFRRVIRIADDVGKPLVIHCVKSVGELLALKKEYSPRNTWILHGFRGKPETAVQLQHSGISLSFGEKFNVRALQATSPDRLFVETDESSLTIEDIYGRVAVALHVSREVLCRQVHQNIVKAFGHLPNLNV